MIPARVAVFSFAPTLRAMSWLPLLGTAVSAGVAVSLIDPAAGEGRALVALRVAAFLLAAGAAFALDDPAASTLAASPTALRARRAHRLLPACAAWGVLWTLALATTAAGAEDAPVAAATLEAGGMLAVALAAAALAAPHTPDGRGGVAAVPVLTLGVLGCVLAQYLYPRWVTLFVMSTAEPEWGAARARWIVVLAVAVAALSATSLDPARRRRRREWPRERSVA